MRSTIKAVFPERDVATMVRPMLTEADLQKLDTLPSSSLRPEFKKVLVAEFVFRRQTSICCTWQRTTVGEAHVVQVPSHRGFGKAQATFSTRQRGGLLQLLPTTSVTI
jgi:hypothetical protein